MHISKEILSVPVVISGRMNRPPSLTVLFFTVRFTVLFTLLSLSFTQQAQSHKLNVFCWSGDQQIYGETYFSGGRKAKNVPVHVQDAKSLVLLFTTKTDQQGKFQFAPPQQAVEQKSDLLISVNAGDGHRGEWLLTADEYLPASTAEASVSSAQSAPSEVSEVSEVPDAASSPQDTKQLNIDNIDMESIRAMIRQEVNKELLPVKRKLAESQDKKPSIQNVLLGIGCIIGFTGILAWFQEKKKNKSING